MALRRVCACVVLVCLVCAQCFGDSVGLNLETVRAYDRSFMLANLAHHAATPSTISDPADGKAKKDSHGNPSGEFAAYFATDQANLRGTYKLSFDGRAMVSGTLGAQVLRQYQDYARNRTTADVYMPDGPRNLVLVFKAVKSPVRNVVLLRPGCDGSKVTTAEFRKAVEPFGMLRFMDAQQTNGSTIKTWDSRKLLSDFGSDRGLSYEEIIAIGNETKKAIWICVPALADDNHIKQLGALLKAKLRSDVQCYVEYSNEVWNWKFPQYAQNIAATKAEIAGGDKNRLKYGGVTDIDRLALRRIAAQCVRLRKLIPLANVRVVLASQVSAPIILDDQLKYMADVHGAPNKFIAAVAGAPYLSLGSAGASSKLTVNDIFKKIQSTNPVGNWSGVQRFHAAAKKYGLKSFGYEGGLDFDPFHMSQAAKTASNKDLRIGGALNAYMWSWYLTGGDTMCWYTLSSQGMRWGLTDDVRVLTGPKYRAAADVAKRVGAK